MDKFTLRDPGYRVRIEDNFALQEVMKTIEASLVDVQPGRVRIRMEYTPKITQQDGFVHAGIVSTVIDSACGYAALSLMEKGKRVLSIEFKLNLLAPAVGDYFFATGTVRKPGKTIFVTEGDLVANRDGEEKLVATMVATMMCVAA